jgi:small subunit ribosomal protein S4
MGFGSTRSEARQLTTHRAFSVNGKVVNIPSYQVKAGDKVAVFGKAVKQVRIIESLSLSQQGVIPSWISIDPKNMEGTFNCLPERSEFFNDINESLIVELYSR